MKDSIKNKMLGYIEILFCCFACPNLCETARRDCQQDKRTKFTQPKKTKMAATRSQRETTSVM